MRAYADTEESLAHLVHDLRQPLGTIDYSACYLELLLSEAGAAVQEQLLLIQKQVEQASRLLEIVANRLSHPRVEREAAEESLDFTNSETAAVT